MRYKVVLCDFDYTLGDSTKAIVKCVNYALSVLGHPPSDADAVSPTVGLSLERTYMELTGDHDEGNASRFAKAFVEEADREEIQDVVMYEGSLDFLMTMREYGAEIGIVTSKLRRRIEEIFAQYDALHLVDLIVGSDTVDRKKPDPEGILEAMGHFSVGPEDVVFIGDTDVDANAAYLAGVDFIAVRTGVSSRQEFARFPTVAVLNDISEVTGFLLDGRSHSS